MTSRSLFLLLYLFGSCFEHSGAESYNNDTCLAEERCSGDSSTNFLHCVGLPSSDTGKDHMRRLKGVLEATMDLYTFMKSSMKGVPVLELQGAVNMKPDVDPLQNEALVEMWLDVKIKPLLSSITRELLTCLGTKNFSCATYQTVVREFSHYFSEMEPFRQKWIYSFFMFPFLSRDQVQGCVNPEEGSEEWLVKNFGAFSAVARLKDFSTLNLIFSGLEVLHLLSPAQKAELLLMPEVQSWDNNTLSLVFSSLMTGGSGSDNSSSPGPPGPLGPPGPRPPQPGSHEQVAQAFISVFRPFGSFAHEFVSLTRERGVSEIKSTTLTQFVLNWTLSELAHMYLPQNTSTSPPMPTFDVTNVEDWYQQVVLPMFQRFFPNSDDLMNKNVTLAFHEVYYLENGVHNETTDVMDVCSVTLDKSPCGLTNVVENVAHILSCAARTNLTMDEGTIMKLMDELITRLNSLLVELSSTNFAELASDFQQIFSEADVPSLSQENLHDPEFIKLWFQIKLMPLLPDVTPPLLSCLSTKNFSCHVYQTIVASLGRHLFMMEADPMYSQNIYQHFIFPFLLHHNSSDAQCLSSVDNSTEWLTTNFGHFSEFAAVPDFYHLNPSFSALEVLPVLSPKQLAELLVLPLPAPPQKDVVINGVFDFLLASPQRLPEVLHHLVQVANEVNPPCEVLTHIIQRLYTAVPSVRVNVEPIIWSTMDELLTVAPVGCVPRNFTCPEIHFNATDICRGINSSDLQAQLTPWSADVPCNFTLEVYACAELENFTANHLASLLQCDLPGESSDSKVLWKMLLSKLSHVLDPALDVLAEMPTTTVVPSATVVLDVIAQMRLSMLTDEQLMNSTAIGTWFSGRLSLFLPSASASFLGCLTDRNFSCQSYQQVLQMFVHNFERMSLKQRRVMLKNFLLPFLSKPQSGPGCVNGSNSSTEWLMKNLGPFSTMLSLGQLLGLNPHFDPMEALALLTPAQCAEILALPDLPDQEYVINKLFDHMAQPPQQHKIPEFLFYLLMFLPQVDLSCSSFKTLFNRLDLATADVPLTVALNISNSKIFIFDHVPPGCSIYGGNCSVTLVNETEICDGVNSTALQLSLTTGGSGGHLCAFPTEELACASASALTALTAQHLAEVMMCNRSSNSSESRPVWKLLLSKASPVLNEALDLMVNMTHPTNPVSSLILDTIRELRLDTVNYTKLNDPAFIQLWFNGRLRPFLPAASPDFLSCLTTRDLNCSSYQHMVQAMGHVQPYMTLGTQMLVYTHFIRVYLMKNTTEDPGCSLFVLNSGDWLQMNIGRFSKLVSLEDLFKLNPSFSPLDALPLMTVKQLAEVSATPGQLQTAEQVDMVMQHVPDQQLPEFFDDFSPAILGHEEEIPPPPRAAMLQVVFDRANLSDHSVSDTVVLLWLHSRLRPLLVGLSPLHVAPFFKILSGRNCSTEQQGVQELQSTISSLSEGTVDGIHEHIILLLTVPVPLRCYGDNYNVSVYDFMEQQFMGFQFPNLTTFLGLMPQDKRPQLLSSMPPSDLEKLLLRPGVTDNQAELCVLYQDYRHTPRFLETVSLPAEVRRPTLPCVWPMALQSSERAEVNAWFTQRLPDYVGYLNKDLIGPSVTYNSSCLAFQQIVLLLGPYNYTAVDFERGDVYDSIRTYLTSATAPRCYDDTNPDLNSTAWFSQYMGPFIIFLTLDDLLSFGSPQVLQVFTVNPLNIALLKQYQLPLNVTNYYTELVYLQDSNFDPSLLPVVSQCVAPGQAFTQLDRDETLTVLHNLSSVCTDVDPEVSAALASNLGNSIDSTAIAALGNESTGLSLGQIKEMKPDDLIASLSALSSITGWNEGQAKAFILLLISSGKFEIADSESLLTLGSLVIGVPASTMGKISGSQLITASQNPQFLIYLMSAPQIIQNIFVTQIISVNSDSQSLIVNVPDEMATEIPRPLLLGFPGDQDFVKKLNKKKWKHQQAELFFNIIAVGNVTEELGGEQNVSSDVLQGFTCTGVRNVKKVKVKKLVKACRRKGKKDKKTKKVKLVESQLTCMLFYIKGESDATDFQLYPHDVLLYYDYSLVPKDKCRFYFEELSEADFSVFSDDLSYKRRKLFENAVQCLDITNTSLSEDSVKVLGNMCCFLEPRYIQNSNPQILEVLKTCSDLSDEQALAVQNLLLSGKTQYGEPSVWNGETLTNLEILPLYMDSDFFDKFDKKTKYYFLKKFLKIYKKKDVGRKRRKRMKKMMRGRKKDKRSLAEECTVGNITQVTVNDNAFTLLYDDAQFNACLTATVVKDNLQAITETVDEEERLRIVLSKLYEAYASSSSIPEDQVQLLGAAARVATVSQINKWTITQIDTLSGLMDPEDGEWDPSLMKVIISKYLSTEGNQLGSAELNTIGGTNLCSLDVDVLQTISQQSIKEADALDLSNCTAEQKKVLFNTAKLAFTSTTRSTEPVSSYQLLKSYTGGADLQYIKSLLKSEVNMDMSIFIGLEETVILALSVDEVKALLGSNVDQLKSYENQTKVNSWITSRYQSDLDTLGLGITGGKADPATTPGAAGQTTAGGGGGGGTTPSGTTAGSSSTEIRANAGLSLLLLLLSVLFVTAQHLVV